MLPENNVPADKVGNQALSGDPGLNFGLFNGKPEPLKLEIKETNLKGYKGKPVGKGVFTLVRTKKNTIKK